MLRHLITSAPPGLFVVCTYRDTDVDRAHPLASMLADLRRSENVHRHAVTGLASDGVRELMVKTGGHDLDEDGARFADVVFAETAGNPLFVSEMLRHFAETGALVERDGRWTGQVALEDAQEDDGAARAQEQRDDRLRVGRGLDPRLRVRHR